MHIEFTSVFDPSREQPDQSGAFPVAALLRHAAFIEDADFDRLTIAGSGPQSTRAAYLVLENSPELGAILTHKIDQMSAESAAEQFGLFDQLAQGRLALRVLPPSASAFGEKHNAHEQIHESLEEYLTLLRRFWASDHSFDFEGRYHRVTRGHAAAKPFNRLNVPIVLSGRSGIAMQVAARHADIFELTPATKAELRRDIERLRESARVYGRADKIAMSLAVRTTIADTREQAVLLARSHEQSNDSPVTEQQLVGTPEQVALQLLALIDVGIGSFTLHGLQDEDQLVAFARKVMPLVRGAASRRASRSPGDLISGAGIVGFYPASRPLIS